METMSYVFVVTLLRSFFLCVYGCVCRGVCVCVKVKLAGNGSFVVDDGQAVL